MPPVNAGTYGNTGGPLDWFNEMPKLSRSYAAAYFFSAVCLKYRISVIFHGFLDWQKVFRGLQVSAYCCTARLLCVSMSQQLAHASNACTP